jgi:hypothetical protein
MTATIRILRDSIVTVNGAPGIVVSYGLLVFKAWWCRSGNSTNRGRSVWVGAWFYAGVQSGNGIIAENRTEVLLRAPNPDDAWAAAR